MTTVCQNFIGGRWLDGTATIENLNPSDVTDLIGHFAQADHQQLELCVEAAREGAREWAQVGAERRYAALMAIGEELKSRSKELGMLLSREEGKPLAEGIGEVYRAGQFFTYYASETLAPCGETADSVRAGVEIDVRREPMGVVAVISPWNFPTATASWKIAPALAYGNAVIWKPANETPASACALADIIARQDLPSGVFNLLMGPGGRIGQALAEHPGIDALTFTGSYETGRRVAAAAASNLCKFQLELGSKNALVVMDDADLDTAIASAIAGAYSGSGQKCTASSRLVVHDAIHDAFVDRMLNALADLKVGHALSEDTKIGPVVSANQLKSNLAYMDLAREEGCEVATGGERLQRDAEGYYMSPALLLRTHNDMRINREEMFAPIAAVIRVADYDEALKVVNDTEFGLTAGIITRSLARATHFRRNAETGCVTINLPTAGTDYHVPFGGRKNSSFGSREQGRYAMEFYTQVKTAYILAGAPD